VHELHLLSGMWVGITRSQTHNPLVLD